MIFGEFKGLGADRSWHHTGYVLFVIICLICLVGFLSGLYSTPFSEPDRIAFRWDMKQAIYFVGELAGFAGGVWSASKYEDADTRLGAIAFLALPPLLVLAVAARTVGIW